MSWLSQVPGYLLIAIVGLAGLYVAARVVTRGVLRSIQNHKRRQ